MISKRLETAAKYLKGFNCLADCGTDHAYLPIYAYSKNYIKKAIASDNKSLPLKNAERNISEANLNSQISLVLADGLAYLNDEIDVVSILGMGGRLISEIIDKAKLTTVKRLILSPNSEAEILRETLEKLSWKIVSEDFLKENKKYYQIIVAEKGQMKLSKIEREFGPINIEENNSDFSEYIQKNIVKLENALAKVNSVDEQEKLRVRITELKEVIK